MKNGKIQTIFISSTFVDLEEHRAAVHAAILKLQNHVEDMVFWSADDRGAADISVDKVKKSDLMITIVAHKYGSVDHRVDISFTEMEYNTARECSIPILAFFVDPTFPWKPGLIDIDLSLRGKLENFKKKIEKDCIRHYYTTPESLAMEVTQAIVNLEKRISPLKDSEPIYKIRTVKSQESVLAEENISVLIGVYDDGLPLVLNIKRFQDDVNTHLTSIAQLIEAEDDKLPMSQIAKLALDEGKRNWRKLGVWNLLLPNQGYKQCYVTSQDLSDLFSPSLLTTIIKTPLELDAKRGTVESATMLVSQEARKTTPSKVQSIGGKNRYFALSVEENDEEYYNVGFQHEKKHTSPPLFWRSFIPESIFAFEDCKYRLIKRESGFTERTISDGTIDGYVDDINRVMSVEKYNPNVLIYPKFSVTVQAVAKIMLEIAQEIRDLHSQNLIHCDIKPQNILLSERKVHLIDNLDLAPDDISPAFSPGWAAPEQITLRPISKSTDVYALGLMLAGLINGSLTGEIVEYTLPKRKSSYRETSIKFIKDPLLFIEPDNSIVPKKARDAWFQFIENCLKYDQEKRYTIDKFVADLNNLLINYPLIGTVGVDIERKTKLELIQLPDMREMVARILTDQWKIPTGMRNGTSYLRFIDT